jgi:superfamily II DNA or RNA helicase
MKTFVPHDYQVQGIEFLLTTMHAGLVWKPGLGKTVCVLTTLKILKDKGMFKRALIVAPKQVALNVWPDEIRKWAHIQGLTLDVLHGPKKDKLLRDSKADILVVTPEGLDWLVPVNGITSERPFDKVGADVLIVDESSYFRHGTSKRFKNIKSILHTFGRRIIMTGTPAPRGLEDLFTQVYIIDMGGALGKYITHYRMTYFDAITKPGTSFTEWQLRPGAAEHIYEKLKPLILHSDAFGKFHMPQLVRQNVVVTLPFAAMRQYERFEREFYIELDNGAEISSPNAAAKAGKLRQIANGFAYDSDHAAEFIHTEKLERLNDLVADLQGEPALLLYEFDADRDRMVASVPGAVLLTGQNERTTRHIIAEFNAGNIPVLIAHPASAGHGLNLQGAAMHVIWYGPTWNLEWDEQATARVWRQGNAANQVFVHTLVARDTKDEDVAEVLRSKDRTQSLLLKALLRRPQQVVVPA